MEPYRGVLPSIAHLDYDGEPVNEGTEKPVEKPQGFKMPDIETYSHALRIARAMFGPLARVRRRFDKVEVVLQRGETVLNVMGIGDDFTASLQHAYDQAEDLRKAGKEIDGALQTGGHNVVMTLRMELAQRLARGGTEVAQKAINAVFKLKPHEVFEAKALDAKTGPDGGDAAHREAAAKALNKLLDVSAARK